MSVPVLPKTLALRVRTVVWPHLAHFYSNRCIGKACVYTSVLCKTKPLSVINRSVVIDALAAATRASITIICLLSPIALNCTACHPGLKGESSRALTWRPHARP